MDVPFAFIGTPAHFSIGPYHVRDRDTIRQLHWSIDVFGVSIPLSKDNGRYFDGTIDGPDLKGGRFACPGGTLPQRADSETSAGSPPEPPRLRCGLNDGARPWTMVFDPPALNPAGEWRASVRSDDGQQHLDVSWSAVGNTGIVEPPDGAAGYYVLSNERVLAAIETFSPGAPRAYLARDIPPDLRPVVVTIMAVVYLLRCPDTPPHWEGPCRSKRCR